jgi:hypothetical protein
MDPKSKFKNVSGGVAGAIQLNHEGKAAGVPVFPNESIWLTEQEEVLTANAPRNESDNPFTNGTFELEVRAEQAAHARPIGSSREPAPASDPQPDTPAVEGSDPEEIDLRTETRGANETPVQSEAPEAEAAQVADVGLPVGAPPEPEGDPVVGRRGENEESAEDQAAAAAPTPPPAASPLPRAGESKREARQRAPKPQTATPAPAPARPAPAAPSE